MKKNVKKGLMVFILLFCTFTVLFTGGIKLYLDHDHAKKMEENEQSGIESLEVREPKLNERVNILLMGVDYLDSKHLKTGASMRTDTIMLFSYDPKTERSFLLSIPRDSRVNIEGHGPDKINHAHAYGGTELSIKTISEFLDQPIHHYVKVDYTAVTELVDAVGGVEVDIPKPMHNDLEKIHFSPGTQTISGDQTMKYLRFRGYPNADITRIQVQQDFIKRLSEKILSPSLVVNIPQYVDILNKNVETDMSKKQLLEISQLFTKIDPSEIRREILVGEPQRIDGLVYWI
ncbi:MAG: LCP family protein, partial [Peptostreptococcaceae bacterium]|nr:LCP family protein [Peptostreptococcaceae bacterium]